MACDNAVDSAQDQLFEVKVIDCYFLIAIVTFYKFPKFFRYRSTSQHTNAFVYQVIVRPELKIVPVIASYE
jgi:hypothetical protein